MWVKSSFTRSSIDQKLGRPVTCGRLIPGFLILFPLSLCERKRSSYVSEISISTLYSHSHSASDQYSSHSCPRESGCCYFVWHVWLSWFETSFSLLVPSGSQSPYCTVRLSSLIPLISITSRQRALGHHMNFGHCTSLSLLIYWTYHLRFQCARINTTLSFECFRSGDGLHPKSCRRPPCGDGR